MDARLRAAIQAIRDQDHDTARRQLRAILARDPNHELAWLWMTHVLQTAPERRYCLEQVLRINPRNEDAQRGLAWLDAVRPRPRTTGRPEEAPPRPSAAPPAKPSPVAPPEEPVPVEPSTAEAEVLIRPTPVVEVPSPPPPTPQAPRQSVERVAPRTLAPGERVAPSPPPARVRAAAAPAVPRPRIRWPRLALRLIVAALGLFVVGFALGILIAALGSGRDQPAARPSPSPVPPTTVLETATAAATPIEEQAEELLLEAKFQGISFTYDPALASIAEGRAILSALDPAASCRSVPAHVRFVFDDYVEPFAEVAPGISILPLDLMMEANDCARGTIPRWQAWFSSQPDPLPDDLSLVPVFEGTPAFFAHVEPLAFANGGGVRFVTQIVDGPAPINSQELVYAFQGQTRDGHYFVSVLLPVSHPALPPDGKAIGEADRAAMEDWETYRLGAEGLLSGQPASSFTPDLAALDTLVRSLHVGTPGPAEDEGDGE